MCTQHLSHPLSTRTLSSHLTVLNDTLPLRICVSGRVRINSDTWTTRLLRNEPTFRFGDWNCGREKRIELIVHVEFISLSFKNLHDSFGQQSSKLNTWVQQMDVEGHDLTAILEKPS